MRKYIGWILAIILFSCENKSNVLDQATYEGPSVTMTNIDMLITDSTKVKLRLIAAKQMVLSNNDRDFPEGIYLEFYNVYGQMTSTLKANRGFYFSEEDYYMAEGNVIMESKMDQRELTTEVLNWVPKEERIHTDNFVTIVTDEDVITGEGLEAKEDLEEYTILKPSGTKVLDKKSKNKSDDGFDADLEFVEDTTQLP